MDLDELITVAESERADHAPVEVRVCLSASCQHSGALEVRDAIARTIAERNLADRVRLREVGCLRLCSEGPLVRVDSEGTDPVLYAKVAPEQAGTIAGAA